MAFMAMAVLLDLNASLLEADDADVVTTMRALASGDLSEEALAEWVRAHEAGTDSATRTCSVLPMFECVATGT